MYWKGIKCGYLWRLQTWKQNTVKLQIVLTAMKRNYISSEFLTKQKKIHVNFTALPAWRSFSVPQVALWTFSASRLVTIIPPTVQSVPLCLFWKEYEF